MNPEIDGIQAPKKRVTKQQIPQASNPPVVAPVVAIPIAKPKRTLTEKQKETLANGRANLKAKKRTTTKRYPGV